MIEVVIRGYQQVKTSSLIFDTPGTNCVTNCLVQEAQSVVIDIKSFPGLLATALDYEATS